MFGKLHSVKAKELMRKVKLGKKLDEKTKKAITISIGTPVFCIYLQITHQNL